MHIEMKTQFKIVYFINSHSKRVRMHGLECPYDADIFMAILYFINLDICVENCLCILYAHFVRTQHL